MDSLYAALVVAGGCTANLLFAGMFVARVAAPRHARQLGFAGTAAALPLTFAAIVAASRSLGGWHVTLPLVFVAFAIGEVVVDGVLRLDFRRTRWLAPYLGAFYLAQWAVVGAAFVAWQPGGFAVLVTYFACLAATAWSYRRVGHGAIA